MKNQAIIQVDAFTDRMYAGNPAAVCLMDAPRSDEWMQNVAMEMNLAETAFLQRENGVYRLRWFTPVAEVDLCGHATLASAHVLWQDGHLGPGESAEFMTRSGRLSARRYGDWISLDFPAIKTERVAPPPGLLEGLKVTPVWVGQNVFDYLVELENEDQVRSLQPDFNELLRIEMRGVIVTARSNDAGFDMVSRFFAPAYGINEDPVTGSAHCALGPYWGAKLSKSTLNAYQASRRGGTLRLELKGERVILSGHAVTVMRGELLDG